MSYSADYDTVLCELELHYRIQRVLQQLGIAVEQRDVSQQNRRLFGAAFDAAPAVGGSSSAGSAGAAAGSNAGSDAKALKRPKVVVELD